MDIRSLGYISVDVADVDAWRAYGSHLGAMVVDQPGGGLFMKIDGRPFRIAIETTEGSDELTAVGWELPDAAAVARASAELQAAGHAVRPATADECSARRVRTMIHTVDPSGFALELFAGTVSDPDRFVSPTGISGFVTGDMGLGHIVLGTPHLADTLAFYTDVLGFRVSDFMHGGSADVAFLRCNPRHHSLALVPASEPVLYHFMLETRTLDDVGFTLDRHHAAGIPYSAGLGKHMGDQMVSFYSTSPSGFDVEFGCGGLRVDEAAWSVGEISSPSYWGHRPVPAGQVG